MLSAEGTDALWTQGQRFSFVYMLILVGGGIQLVRTQQSVTPALAFCVRFSAEWMSVASAWHFCLFVFLNSVIHVKKMLCSFDLRKKMEHEADNINVQTRLAVDRWRRYTGYTMVSSTQPLQPRSAVLR